MRYSLFNASNAQEVITLFKDVFSASEGVSEGQVIGDLVSDLIFTTKSKDLIGCIAMENDCMVGSIFFSSFTVPTSQRAFILSPVAVSTTLQGKGIGQQLIHYGLDHLRSLNCALVFTYGDPAFYSKTGFEQISENIVKAPHPLSQPEGWLAQTLDGKPIPVIQGASRCVDALSHAKYW